MFKKKFFKWKRKIKKEDCVVQSAPESEMPTTDNLSIDDCNDSDDYENVSDNVNDDDGGGGGGDDDDDDYERCNGDFHYDYAYMQTTQIKRTSSVPQKKPSLRRNYNKEAIGELPLQHVSSNRRMEDLDDDDYGYSTSDAVYNALKKKEINFKDVFMDAQKFVPYQDNNDSPMVSRFFFSQNGDYDKLSPVEISQKMDTASTNEQQDLRKFIAVRLLPTLRINNKIFDIFTLLSSKNKHIRSLCIQELTEMILEIDTTKFARDDLVKLYEFGTEQLFSVIAETKKTFSIFQPLIELGIVFNCFIYLKAIEATDDWSACIRRLVTGIQPKIQRVIERSDQDVRVFSETAKCIFELENVNLDESLLLGEDMDEFISEFNREDSDIFIEGLASLFHTGNLILRQQSKFKSGVQRLVRMASFMDGSEDEGMVKWFHRLLGQFVLRILHQEHHGVKVEELEQCENDLFSILNQKTFHPEAFSLMHSLMFYHKESVRSKYKEIAETKGASFTNETMELYIQTLLKKCGLVFDGSTSVSHVSDIVERKQCTFCNEDASITRISEAFPEESKTVVMKDNKPTVKTRLRQTNERKRDLENEMNVLKEIESKEIHQNVVRLLAFNQPFPKFYIKERLPGDNLQRRLLEAREKDKIIPISNLIRIIIQAIQAVLYVHSRGCLVRDITTASFGCSVTDDGYFLKLKNFENAAKPSEFSNDGIINGLIDLDFYGIPVRWAAPESLLEGHYSIYSDVWSVNILADEILNYAAWPYSDISDADINDMVINIVFTHLKPQGFNRPKRVQGLILEGLANVPEQRLKLEALRERLLEILDNVDGGGSCTLYDTYSGVEGSCIKTYDIPPLTERQIRANSKFERGIPPSIQKYRELDEDPATIFALEVAENNNRLKEQSGVGLMEISDDYLYNIESEGRTCVLKVTEKVTDDFLKHTYNRLKEIDGKKMCVEPWPPTKSASADGLKLHYRFPKSTHLLDIVLHKDRGVSIDPYIELLYELANHVDSFHSAGWIFRSLRAKNVWILEQREKEQTIVVPKFGKYRKIVSENEMHFEQIKVESQEDVEGVQWLPIETIKAGLYSKESDVYSYGMITWEVMSAFGQEGVVYDQDEERELTCIPFNYQQSENILQHLIEGYIPEKPMKCPDWFYQEVTRPCLLHQKILRPSIKTIVQILQTKLGKTLPKQILSLPPSAVETCKDEEISGNCQRKVQLPKPLNTANAKSSPHFAGRCQFQDDKESQEGEHRRSLPPPPVPRKPSNPKQVTSDVSDSSIPLVPRYNRNTEENLKYTDSNDIVPSLPKRLPQQGFTEDREASRMNNVNSDKFLSANVIDLPIKQACIAMETDQYEDVSDYESGSKSRTLSSLVIEPNDNNPSVTNMSPSQIPVAFGNINEIESIRNEYRKLPPPPVPPKPRNQKPSMQCPSLESCKNTEDHHDNAPPDKKNQMPMDLPECKETSRMSDVNSCKLLPLPNIPEHAENEGECKHPNFRNPSVRPIPPFPQNRGPSTPIHPKSGSANNSKSDLNATEFDEPNTKENFIKKSSIDFDNSSDIYFAVESKFNDEIEDTHKGSDFYGDDTFAGEDPLGRSDFVLSYQDDSGDSRVKGNDIATVCKNTSLSYKTKPEVLPKPKSKPKAFCKISTQESVANYELTETQVNINEEDTKPALPPRKPFDK